MTAGAAPPLGRRVSLGGAAVLAIYLLGPSLYFLGPFALLALLARPRTLWELFWLLVAAAGVTANFVGAGGVADDVFRASGLILTAAFGLVSLRPRGEPFSRALVAVAVTLAGMVIWASVTGVTWGEIERAFVELFRAAAQDMASATTQDPDTRRQLLGISQSMSAAAPEAARLVPGGMALSALAGLSLAWRWHHRISATPLGWPPPPFREFRFNDHLVWGAIFTLGILLVPLPPIWHMVAANLLVVWAGLYIVRGLAVAAAILTPAPPLLKVMAGGLALLIAPVAVGAWVMLGLADTWIDVRSRLKPREP